MLYVYSRGRVRQSPVQCMEEGKGGTGEIQEKGGSKKEVGRVEQGRTFLAGLT